MMRVVMRVGYSSDEDNDEGSDESWWINFT